ncbi:MAG: hypothetical protein Q4D26_04845 [Clostridia bacterium]|nr:hypothetical protein [Clostridia bacterium]
MLNLLYYDMKATVKRSWCYIIIIALLAVLVRFLCSTAFLSFFTDINFIYGYVIRVVAGGFLAAFGVLITLIVIVYQAQWFDENILSSEGQLTNMLPVSSWQIILSKVLTSLIWSVILVLMAIGVVCIVMVGTEYFEAFAKSVVEIGADNNVDISVAGLMTSVGFYVVTGITSFVSLCFVSQMIGQIFGVLRNVIILISFIGILALSLFMEYKAAMLLGVIVPAGIDAGDIVSFCIQASAKLTVINIFSTVVYWLISSFILKKFLSVV